MRVAVVLLLFVPKAAIAGPLFLGEPRPLALAGAYTALSNDSNALDHNPAGLARIDGSLASLSFHFVSPQLTADDKSVSEPSDEGYSLRFAWSPTEVLGGELGFGVSLFLPHRRALNFTIHPTDEPYFVLAENETELLEIRLGLAYRFFDRLSIGASVLLLAGLDGHVNIVAPFQSNEVDPNKRTRVDLAADLPNQEFFAAGAQFRLLDGLDVGLVYRQASYVRIHLPIDFSPQVFGLDLATGSDLDLRVKHIPEQVTIGVAYSPTDELLISLDVVYAHFADYELPYGNVTLDVSRIGEGITLLPPLRPVADLTDVWIPKLGAEWSPLEGLDLRAGYSYQATFIESVDQPVLDSAKHIFALGVGQDVHEWLLGEASDAKWSFSAGANLVSFASRTTGPIRHGGFVFSAAIGTSIQY